MLYEYHRAIDLRLYLVDVAASIASGLTISGAYVLCGVMVMRIMSKLSIIIKGEYLYEK